MELDTKLEDFATTRTEISNYQLVVNDKYEALDFPNAIQVTEIIEKFKNKHRNITLV